MKKEYYYHPVCHLINGKRLYFILISIKSSLEHAKGEIINIIRGTDLKTDFDLRPESQCSYSIIGETDILLKIWICEEKLNILKERLKFVDSISKSKIILIKNTDTWYERELTKQSCSLDEKELNAIISSDGFQDEDFPTKKLRLPLPKGKRKLNKPLGKNESFHKVWVFVEYPHAFPELTLSKIQANIIAEEEKLTTIKFISFYRYHTNDKKGIIIKADINDLSTSLESLFTLIHKDHPKDLEYGSTTYISQSLIREETHDWRLDDDRDRPSKLNHAISNLVTKHDCSRHSKEVISLKMTNMAEQFIQEVTKYFYMIYKNYCFEGWDESVEEVRILYKWIVFGNDRSLKNFFQNEYSKIERDLSELLSQHYDQIKFQVNGYNRVCKILQRKLEIDAETAKDTLSVINKNHKLFSEHLTLGNVSHTLSAALKKRGLDEEQTTLVTKLKKIFENMAKLRNPLAHGNINNLARGQKNDTKEYYWRAYLTNYIEYLFYVKPRLKQLSECLDFDELKK